MFEPVGKFVVLEDVDDGQKLTMQGILIVRIESKTMKKCKVLAVGDECEMLKVGDIVLAGVAGYTPVDHNGIEGMCVLEEKCLMVLNPA